MALIASTALLVLTLAADDAAPRPMPRAVARAKTQTKKDAKPPLRRPEFQAKKVTSATTSPPFPTGLRNPFVDAANASATKPTKAATLSGELKNPFPGGGQATVNTGAHPPPRAQLVTAGNDLQDPFPAQTPRPTGQQAPLPTGLKNPFVDPAAGATASSSSTPSSSSSSPSKPASSSAAKQPSAPTATATRCGEVPTNAVDAHAPVPCPPPAPSSKSPTKDG